MGNSLQWALFIERGEMSLESKSSHIKHWLIQKSEIYLFGNKTKNSNKNSRFKEHCLFCISAVYRQCKQKFSHCARSTEWSTSQSGQLSSVLHCGRLCGQPCGRLTLPAQIVLEPAVDWPQSKSFVHMWLTARSIGWALSLQSGRPVAT